MPVSNHFVKAGILISFNAFHLKQHLNNSELSSQRYIGPASLLTADNLAYIKVFAFSVFFKVKVLFVRFFVLFFTERNNRICLNDDPNSNECRVKGTAVVQGFLITGI